MTSLQCTNKECSSRGNGEDEPVFTVNMVVDENGAACESARKIAGKYFICCFCESDAEWKVKE